MDGRIVRLEGIDNFRDYGGYDTGGGRKLRPGLLYRSAGHGAATDADLDAMAAMGIGVIVDLRRGEERGRLPSRRHAAFTGQVIENDLGDVATDPWLEFIKTSDASEASFRGYLLNYYRHAPFEPRHIDLFTRYFRVLAEADGPVLIHCAAGKDRTGLLAALTHHLMGVHRDDIFADYLLTNMVAPFEKRMPIVIQTITDLSGHTPSEAAVRTAMAVHEDYLETAFAVIGERHGGLDGYIETELGVDAALREAIAARLLA